MRLEEQDERYANKIRKSINCIRLLIENSQEHAHIRLLPEMLTKNTGLQEGHASFIKLRREN